MKIWYDTEFIEDGRTIDLISIGLVRDDGAEYYAVSSEIDQWTPGGSEKLHKRISNHRWLMENVVPHLPLTKPLSTFENYWLWSLDRSSLLVKPTWVIANEVREFILAADEPELWAWYGAYDHVALCQLWGPMIRLPKGVPMWTNDLKQECQRLGNPQVPEQESGEHNALADARHNKVIAEFLDLAARRQRVKG
jgi:hypothetical protein